MTHLVRLFWVSNVIFRTKRAIENRSNKKWPQKNWIYSIKNSELKLNHFDSAFSLTDLGFCKII